MYTPSHSFCCPFFFVTNIPRSIALKNDAFKSKMIITLNLFQIIPHKQNYTHNHQCKYECKYNYNYKYKCKTNTESTMPWHQPKEHKNVLPAPVYLTSKRTGSKIQEPTRSLSLLPWHAVYARPGASTPSHVRMSELLLLPGRLLSVLSRNKLCSRNKRDIHIRIITLCMLCSIYRL